MRVLMTGCTLNHCGGEARMRLAYASTPEILHRAIVRAGHEVDRRQVVPGEDLGRYDCIIVGLYNALSFGARFTLGALWAAGHSNVGYLIDDWNIGGTIGSLRGCARGSVDQALMRSVLPRDHKREAWDHIQEIMGTLDSLDKGPWTKPTLASFFNWGDPGLFFRNTPVGEVWRFDPTSLQPQFRPMRPPLEDRERSWAMAALPDHSRWIDGFGFSWPVRVYGHKRSRLPRLPEAQIVGQVYPSSWGVLSPPYKHAGSGWWRVRFWHAIEAGCLLLAEEAEVRALGRDYTLSDYAIQELEALPMVAWRDLVEAQRATFMEYMWDEDTFVQWADGMIRRLAAL